MSWIRYNFTVHAWSSRRPIHVRIRTTSYRQYRPGRNTEQRTDPDRTDPPSDDGESDVSDVDVSMELQAEKTADGASGIDGGHVSTDSAW